MEHTTQTDPISVGRLAAMLPADRAATIDSLSSDVRMKLAHLASLGAEQYMTRTAEYLAKGHNVLAIDQIVAARTRSEIAAALTAKDLTYP